MQHTVSPKKSLVSPAWLYFIIIFIVVLCMLLPTLRLLLAQEGYKSHKQTSNIYIHIKTEAQEAQWCFLYYICDYVLGNNVIWHHYCFHCALLISHFPGTIIVIVSPLSIVLMQIMVTLSFLHGPAIWLYSSYPLQCANNQISRAISYSAGIFWIFHVVCRQYKENLKDHLLPYYPCCQLKSFQVQLTITSTAEVRQVTMRDRAFSVVALYLWHVFPIVWFTYFP